MGSTAGSPVLAGPTTDLARPVGVLYYMEDDVGGEEVTVVPNIDTPVSGETVDEPTTASPVSGGTVDEPTEAPTMSGVAHNRLGTTWSVMVSTAMGMFVLVLSF